MKRKKSLLLMLAASVISGMFSVGVNAVGFNFSLPQGNLLVHDVNVDGENFTIRPENDEVISFTLDAAKRETKQFAFEVNPDSLKRSGIDLEILENHWLGAGGADFNAANDYDFRVNFINGAGMVLFRIIRGNSARILDSGKIVRPLIVEFKANDVQQPTSVNGILEVSGAGKTQRVPFFGIVSNNNVKGKKFKTCTILDDSDEDAQDEEAGSKEDMLQKHQI